MKIIYSVNLDTQVISGLVVNPLSATQKSQNYNVRDTSYSFTEVKIK